MALAAVVDYSLPAGLLTSLYKGGSH